METLREGLGGEVRTVTVSGPRGGAVECPYLVLPGGAAVVELAGAAGLPLLPPSERDPMHTTTYGVGQVLRAAMADGCRRFLVGIGGSATNDGGAGMLMALGFDLLDENGDPIPLGAAGLEGYIARSDVVITGEGRLDAQTAMGKAPAGAAALAKRYSLPVVALCGCLGEGAGACRDSGIDAYFPILRRVTTPEEAMDPAAAAENLADTAEEVFRLYRSARREKYIVYCKG